MLQQSIRSPRLAPQIENQYLSMVQHVVKHHNVDIIIFINCMIKMIVNSKNKNIDHRLSEANVLNHDKNN